MGHRYVSKGVLGAMHVSGSLCLADRNSDDLTHAKGIEGVLESDLWFLLIIHCVNVEFLIHLLGRHDSNGIREARGRERCFDEWRGGCG